MKEVKLRMVVDLYFRSSAKDDAAAYLEAEEAVRALYKGKSYRIEIVGVKDVPEGRLGLEIVKP